jgi:heme/copper-type cytochrome/quinol oxidase subunit 2
MKNICIIKNMKLIITMIVINFILVIVSFVIKFFMFTKIINLEDGLKTCLDYIETNELQMKNLVNDINFNDDKLSVPHSHL